MTIESKEQSRLWHAFLALEITASHFEIRVPLNGAHSKSARYRRTSAEPAGRQDYKFSHSRCENLSRPHFPALEDEARQLDRTDSEPLRIPVTGNQGANSFGPARGTAAGEPRDDHVVQRYRPAYRRSSGRRHVGKIRRGEPCKGSTCRISRCQRLFSCQPLANEALL